MRIGWSLGSVVATVSILASCARSEEDGNAALPSSPGQGSTAAPRPSASPSSTPQSSGAHSEATSALSGSGQGARPEGSTSVPGAVSSVPEKDAHVPAEAGRTETDAGSPEPDAGPTEPDAPAPANSDAGSGTQLWLPAEPVVWKGLSVAEDANARFSAPSVASCGDEGAVAYVENVGEARRIVLQRFDATGERLGQAVALGSQPDLNVGPTLASDGQQYVVCWSDTHVHCSLLDQEHHPQADVIELEGRYPKIVFAHGKWVLSYFTADEQIHLQVLSSALQLKGDSITHNGSLGYHAPLLVATESGFALVGARPTEEPEAHLYRLDPDLELTLAPQPLGREFWYFGDLAATDSRAVVSLSVPYGSYTLLLGPEGIEHVLGLGGGGKTGMYLALSAVDGGIVGAWLTSNAELKTRFFADGDPELDLLTPADTEGNGLRFPQGGAESYQQFVQVGGRTLLVTMQGSFGAGEYGLRVTTLTTR